MFVSTNWRLPLMQVVPGPGRLAARAEIYSLVQQGQAAFPGRVITGLPLYGLPEHAGQKLRDRGAPPRRENPRLPQVLFGQGEGDVLVGHPRPHGSACFTLNSVSRNTVDCGGRWEPGYLCGGGNQDRSGPWVTGPVRTDYRGGDVIFHSSVSRPSGCTLL